MEVDLNRQVNGDGLAEALGRAEAPVLDGAEGGFIESEAETLLDANLLGATAFIHNGPQHHDALVAGLAGFLGILGIGAVDALGSRDIATDAKGPAAGAAPPAGAYPGAPTPADAAAGAGANAAAASGPA